MKAERAVSFAKVAARAQYRRAVEAAIWGMPLVSFAAMRRAYFRDAGAQYNDVVYWSKPADWRYQVVGADSTTLHAVFFVNLIGGPVIIHIPRAEDAILLGALVDAWNVPLVTVGCAGLDRGEGADYALLPPHDVPAPAGCVTVASDTYNVFSSVRIVPRSYEAQDISRSIECLKRIRIQRASGEGVPPRFIEMPGLLFDSTMRFDASFYTSLARMVLEEPVKPHDLAFMGQLQTIGIGKSAAFRADAALDRLLDAAVHEAHAHVIQGFQLAGSRWWPHRRWRSMLDREVLDSNGSCVRADRILIDERAQLAFTALGTGIGASQNLCLKTFEDSQGRVLNGTNAYRLRIPANVPTRQFWSVTVYDSDTAAFIRKAPVIGLDSFNDGLTLNADGSVDLDLSPLPLEAREANWIATAVNRPFFVIFRNCAACDDVLERTSSWVLSDIERLDNENPLRG